MLLLLSTAAALAQAVCDPPTTGNGTVTIPTDFPSIDVAVGALGPALDGYTIRLLPGVYPTSAAINNYDVTIEGDGCGTTVLETTGPNILSFTNSRSEIRNVLFRTGEDPRGRGVNSSNSHITLVQACFDSLGATASPPIAEGAAVRSEGSNLCLDGVTVDGSRATDGAGLYASSGSGNVVQIVKSVFSSNVADTDGGAAEIRGGSVEVVDSDVTGNKAGLRGGGLFLINAGSQLVDSRFIGNSAAHGGGLSTAFGDLVITGGRYEGNHALGSGGAASVSSANATIDGAIVSSNRAEVMGGGIASTSTGLLKVAGGPLAGNSAGHRGGAISHDGSGIGSLSLVGLSFSDNVAGQYGGAVHYQNRSADPGTLVDISDNEFFANSAGGLGNIGEGGAISVVDAGSVILHRSAFVGNDTFGSTRRGGAVRAIRAQDLAGSENFFCGNVAAQGAAVMSSFPTGTDQWSDNIFANQRSAVWGGALLYNQGSDLVFSHNTLVNNDGTHSGSLSLANTLAGASIVVDSNVVAYDDGTAAIPNWGAIHADGASTAELIAGWTQNVCHDNNPVDVAVDPASAPPVCVAGAPAVADPSLVDCYALTPAQLEVDSNYAGFGADVSQVRFP